MAPAAAAASSDAVKNRVLREDIGGVPRALRLLAALVEAECRFQPARPARSDLVRAFRGATAASAADAGTELDQRLHGGVVFDTGAVTPTVPIGQFLERVHRFLRLQDVGHVVGFQPNCYVLAGIYLKRFLDSPAAREARFTMEATTVHRLVAAALFVATKFDSDKTLPKRWISVFQMSSDGVIRASEIPALERLFLRTVGYRLFVTGDCFDEFCEVLEKGPSARCRSCSHCRKRKASAAAAGEEQKEHGDERRRVRPRLQPPPPAVVTH